MTKEQSELYLSYFRKIKRDYNGDIKTLHFKMDELLLEVLETIVKDNPEIREGIRGIIKEFSDADKWYA